MEDAAEATGRSAGPDLDRDTVPVGDDIAWGAILCASVASGAYLIGQAPR